MKTIKIIFSGIFLVLFSLFVSQNTIAQTIDCYVVGYPPALSPSRVLVNDPVVFQDVRVGIPMGAITAYKFKDDLAFVNTTTYTYTTTGTFSVTVAAGLVGTTTSTRKADYIQVLPTNIPDISVKSCTGKIRVKINAQNYDRYAIKIGSLPVQYVTNPPNAYLDFPVAFSGLYNVSVQGEYLAFGTTYLSNNATKASTQVQVFTATSQFSVTNFLVLNFEKISICEGEITLKLQDLSTDFKYEIYYSKEEFVNYELLKTLENKSGTDETVLRNLNTLTQPNYIKIIMTNSCGESKELKNATSATYTGTLPLYVRKLNATYKDDNSVQILWDSYNLPYKDFETFTVERNGTVLQTISKLITYNDPTPVRKNCYQVGYTNPCGVVVSAKLQTCPIYLEITKNEAQEKQFEWNRYKNGDDEATTYALLKLDGQGNLIKRWELANSLQFTENEVDNENQIVVYKVEGKTATYKTTSNALRLEQRFQLHFPDVFTPNNDTHNDTFFSKGRFVKIYQLTIYDRNGVQLFSTQKQEEGWDGTFQGTQMPTGVYVWIAEAQDFVGKTYKETRTFLLSR